MDHDYTTLQRGCGWAASNNLVVDEEMRRYVGCACYLVDEQLGWSQAQSRHICNQPTTRLHSIDTKFIIVLPSGICLTLPERKDENLFVGNNFSKSNRPSSHQFSSSLLKPSKYQYVVGNEWPLNII